MVSDGEVIGRHLLSPNTYKRLFYFHERLCRWNCEEPRISPDVFSIIKEEASKRCYGPPSHFTRHTVSQILKNVNIPDEIAETHRSRRFKMQPLTKKRLYDKYFEKWKTICWMLSGVKPLLPSADLLRLMETLFVGTLKPFSMYRHDPACDRRHKCARFFKCWHNFINYDFIFIKQLQLAQFFFNHPRAYDDFKGDFSLARQRIRDNKLRPMWLKIAKYNNWPLINNE